MIAPSVSRRKSLRWRRIRRSFPRRRGMPRLRSAGRPGQGRPAVRWIRERRRYAPQFLWIAVQPPSGHCQRTRLGGPLPARSSAMPRASVAYRALPSCEAQRGRRASIMHAGERFHTGAFTGHDAFWVCAGDSQQSYTWSRSASSRVARRIPISGQVGQHPRGP